jgi:hypothetical protein
MGDGSYIKAQKQGSLRTHRVPFLMVCLEHFLL